MNEMYEEILVQARPDNKSRGLSIVLYLVGALCLVGGFMANVLLLLPGIAALIAGYIFMTRVHREYEYAYTSGQLDIDVIYNRTRRKRIASYDLEQLVFLAPKGSAALDRYPKSAVEKDYTSGDPGKPCFVALYNGSKGQETLYLEFTAPVANNVRMLKPRCVSMN